MKKRLVTLLMCSVALIASATDTVTLVQVDGSESVHMLETVGRLEFYGSGTTYKFVSRDGGEVLEEGSVADLAQLNFLGASESGGIVTPVFELKYDEVQSTDDALVGIYDMQGRKVSSGSTRGLAKGIYIVVSKLRTAKILVK